jgi:prolyl-tRNA synthetase
LVVGVDGKNSTRKTPSLPLSLFPSLSLSSSLNEKKTKKRTTNRRHMCLAPWADEKEVEDDVRKRSATADAMGAKTLCIPFEQPELPEGTKCFASGKPAKNWALWGRSY